MSWKKRHWVWNLLIVATLIICALAFLAHYKNWTRIKDDRLEILSGIYYLELLALLFFLEVLRQL